MGRSMLVTRGLCLAVLAGSAACSDKEAPGSAGTGGISAGGSALPGGGAGRGSGGSSTGNGGRSLGLGGAVTANGGSTVAGSTTGFGGQGQGGDTSAAASGGQSSSSGGNSQMGGAASGGKSVGGSNATGGMPAGGSSSGGAYGSTAGAGAGAGAPTAGGFHSGGSASGGAATAGAAGETAYLVEGVHGRIDVIRSSATPSAADVRVQLYDVRQRMEAFAPFPPDLHEITLRQGDCILSKAATLACNPPCGVDQFCGTGSVCKSAAAIVSAGNIIVQGPIDGVTLAPTSLGYGSGTIAASNISASATISATAAGVSGAMAGFVIASLGVDESGIGLPAANSTFKLTNGGDNSVTWNAVPAGTVQLLLNSGWHGATPVATLLCETPASAGKLIIPRALVEAFPAVTSGGMGLEQHTSTVTLFRRSRITSGNRTVELVVTGYRALIWPEH